MFFDQKRREDFIKELQEFLKSLQLQHKSPAINSDRFIFKTARTKAHRMKLIEQFMRVLSAGVCYFLLVILVLCCGVVLLYFLTCDTSSVGYVTFLVVILVLFTGLSVHTRSTF